MNDRRKILEMLRESLITVEEAEQLLDALPGEGTVKRTAPIVPKLLHIETTEGGQPKRNIRLPFPLVRAGLRLGQSFGAFGSGEGGDTQQKVMELLREIDVDRLLEDIGSGDAALPYTLIDMEDAFKDQIIRVILE